MLGEKLPKCSYQTVADKYVSCGLYLLGLSSFEHGLVYAITVGHIEDVDAGTVDGVAAVVYAGFWVLFHFYLYWDLKRARRTAQTAHEDAISASS